MQKTTITIETDDLKVESTSIEVIAKIMSKFQVPSETIIQLFSSYQEFILGDTLGKTFYSGAYRISFDKPNKGE